MVKLRDEALAIWKAGVQAVTPQRLFAEKICLEGDVLTIDEQIVVDLRRFKRIVVVGAGKGAAGMASELYRQHLQRLTHCELAGWINAPEGTFTPGDAGPRIHLHSARPAGINEPTEAAVYGTQKILELVKQASHHDLVLVLLSGGGSALLVATPDGITLGDKQAVAQLIAAAGGNIEQLNTVRRAISEVKGGKLARACRAARMITLIISDVLGDSLPTIASGPTILAAHTEPAHALNVLRELNLQNDPRLQRVFEYLSTAPRSPAPVGRGQTNPAVEHVILANNATAVDAAGVHAVELGYRYVMQSARGPEGDVLHLASQLSVGVEQLLVQDQVDCLISGGEPTVRLPDAKHRGKGGRNQQLALAVMNTLLQRGWPSHYSRSCIFLSGGTDGEDGPTTAAGAYFDRQVLENAISQGLQLNDFLNRADAYSFFERCGGLIQTGPTNTNVCDLRIAIAR
jgi:hydroxypyruvate reductase